MFTSHVRLEPLQPDESVKQLGNGPQEIPRTKARLEVSLRNIRGPRFQRGGDVQWLVLQVVPAAQRSGLNEMVH